MSIWEELDEVGSELVGSIGGSLARRVGAEIEGGPPPGAEGNPDMIVQLPENGPEQREATQSVTQRMQDTLSGYKPWIALGLGVVAFVAIRRAR